MYKKLQKYFSHNPLYNSFVYLMLGIGVGVLITYPYIGIHPLRYGIAFLAVGFFGHLLPFISKK